MLQKTMSAKRIWLPLVLCAGLLLALDANASAATSAAASTAAAA